MKVIDRYYASVRESELERTITDGVVHLGGIVWSVRDSRRMNVKDMPDLLIVAPWCGLVTLLELKSQRREVTAGQAHALDLLRSCDRAASGIVRPVPREGEMSLDEALGLLEVPAR